MGKMHLYYIDEEGGNPTLTIEKSQDVIDKTISEFDKVVAKIQNHESYTETKNKKSCLNCNMRYYCKK